MSAKAQRRPDCGAPLASSAHDILLSRLDELVETRETILDATRITELHELRIAAKRLRYSLEMFAVCFPDKQATEWADGVREMQDVLGRIHDLDVLHDLLQEQIGRIEAEAREAALRVATTPTDGDSRAGDLIRYTQSDGVADGRLGLYKVIAAKADERRDLYRQFEHLWNKWQDAGLLTSIRDALSSGRPVEH